MKRQRSFNSVAMWVVLDNKILLCTKFTYLGILILMLQNICILWCADNLQTTSRQSEIYTSGGFTSSGSSRHQRQTAKWRTYDCTDLLVMMQNISEVFLFLSVFLCCYFYPSFIFLVHIWCIFLSYSPWLFDPLKKQNTVHLIYPTDSALPANILILSYYMFT